MILCSPHEYTFGLAMGFSNSSAKLMTIYISIAIFKTKCLAKRDRSSAILIAEWVLCQFDSSIISAKYPDSHIGAAFSLLSFLLFIDFTTVQIYSFKLHYQSKL